MVAHGEVWWIDFGEPVGSEPAYLRPALVVSSDRFNRSRIATVVVSAITGNRISAGGGKTAGHGTKGQNFVCKTFSKNREKIFLPPPDSKS